MATVQNRPRGPDIKLTVHEFVTLDGVMQGPGAPEEDTSGGFDRGGWVVPFVDEDFGRIVDGWFRSTTELLYGPPTSSWPATGHRSPTPMTTSLRRPTRARSTWPPPRPPPRSGATRPASSPRTSPPRPGRSR